MGVAMGVAVAAAECGMDRGVKDCEALDRDTWKTLFFGFVFRFEGAVVRRSVPDAADADAADAADDDDADAAGGVFFFFFFFLAVGAGACGRCTPPFSPNSLHRASAWATMSFISLWAPLASRTPTQLMRMPFFSARPSFLLLRPKITGMPCTRQLSMATFTWSSRPPVRFPSSMFGQTMQHSSLFFRESRLTSRSPMTRRRRRLAFAGSFAYSLRWNSCSFCKNGTIFLSSSGSKHWLT